MHSHTQHTHILPLFMWLFIACKMNVHHRCHSLVPHTCGQDNTEPYGRIQMLIRCIPLKEDSQRINIQGNS